MKNLRQYLFVINELVSREVKRKYARSYLGILWSVLNPLLSMVVMSLIFSTIFKRSIDNYPVYYLTGTIIWNLFTGATNSAMTALLDNKILMTRTKLPRQIFPLSRILTALVNFGYSLVAYVLIVVFFQIRPTIHLTVFPFIILFLLLFCTGVSYMLSIAYTFMPDIQYLYSVLLQLWMYLAAIFYPVESLSPRMQTVVTMNPMYAYIAAARGCVLYHQWPAAAQWIQMAGWGIGMFLVGKYVFQSNQNKLVIQNM